VRAIIGSKTGEVRFIYVYIYIYRERERHIYIYIYIYKNRARTAQEIIAVCSQIHTKHINTLCGQNVELLNVKLPVHIVTTVRYI